MRTFRPGTAADLDALVAVESEPATARWLCETGRAYQERAFADPTQRHVVAVDEDGTVLGFGLLAGLGRADRVVEIRRIALAAVHTGHGHGRALLRELLRQCYAELGALRVWLDVKPDNERARALYRAEGFVETGSATTQVSGSVVDLLLLDHRPGLEEFRPSVEEFVFDCAEPGPLALFWSRLLGGKPIERSPDWAYVDPPHFARLAFQRVPEPKQVKNRVHPDVNVSDIPAATRAAELLGATRIDGIVVDAHGAFQVMRDPQGNEFCFVADAPSTASPSATPPSDAGN